MQDPSPEMAAPTYTVLVVDDDRPIRALARGLLERDGLRVLEAADGAEALALLSRESVDLVVLDLLMPPPDGFATCTALRALVPAAELPVVVLTASEDLDVVDRAFAAGATDFLTKPFLRALLVRRVRSALHGRDTHRSLREHAQRLALAQRLARVGYWQVDGPARTWTLSPEGAGLLGARASACKSLEQYLALVHAEDVALVRAALEEALSARAGFSVEHRLRVGPGRERIVVLEGEWQTEPERLFGTVQDVTERRRAAAVIRYQTYFDALTDLPNRRLLRDRAVQMAQGPSSSGQPLTLYFIGVDRLRLINDTLGHSFGDHILRGIAERLRTFAGEGRFVARFEGDVFAVAEPAPENPAAVDRFAATLLDGVRQPFWVDGQEVVVSASIGVVRHAEVADPGALFQAADLAMRRARVEGGDQYRCYQQDMDVHVRQRLRLESDLRAAIREGALTVHYQPQVDAVTGRITGAEALVRWRHPERGLIGPVEFIPIAEETGLIIPLGLYVLRAACLQAEAWRQQGFGSLRMGVNLSARQFLHAGLADTVEQALCESGLMPAWLDLEITESMAMVDPAHSAALLGHFRSLGVGVSIDDFGTGHSSLASLHRLPIDTLKIDRSFVASIGPGRDGGTITRAIVAMARSLNLHVVAEGVETEAQRLCLVEEGVDTLQGELFGPPLDPAAFARLLAQGGYALASANA